jgi:hypothetical protein
MGPNGWVTPVFMRDVHRLKSRNQKEAREEAEKWLAELEEEQNK